MTALAEKILAQLRDTGAMTFRDFMQAALYDRKLGYYNTERLKIGAAGDYYTSSNVHPAFGAILARAFVELWRELDEQETPLTLVEMGAGTGQLAFDVLTALGAEDAALLAQTRYVIVEQSAAMRARQQQRLSAFASQISWRRLDELAAAPLAAVAFANELVDAFPVHRLRWQRGGWQELYVVLEDAVENRRETKGETAGEATTTGERLGLAWRAPSTAALADYIERFNLRPGDGQIVEINLDVLGWLAQLSRALRRGFLVTIDYGDEAAHLYAPERRAGTLRCFYRHTLNDAPLARIGEQDITASVNFSALIEYGRDYGFETRSYERQTAFLFRLGLLERVAALVAGGTLDDLQQRLAIKNLLAPGGISDNFRVLIQRRC